MRHDVKKLIAFSLVAGVLVWAGAEATPQCKTMATQAAVRARLEAFMVVPLDQAGEPSTPDCSEKIRNYPGIKKTGSIGAGGKAESRDDIPFSYAGMTRVRFRGFLSGYPATPNGLSKTYPEDPPVSRRGAGGERFLHLVFYRSETEGEGEGRFGVVQIELGVLRGDPVNGPLRPR